MIDQAWNNAVREAAAKHSALRTSLPDALDHTALEDAFALGAIFENKRVEQLAKSQLSVAQLKETMRGNHRVNPATFSSWEEHVAYLELSLEALRQSVQPAINSSMRFGGPSGTRC